MIDLTIALMAARPGEKWSLNGDEYPGLNWEDETPKPSLEELQTAYDLEIPKIAAVAEIERLEGLLTKRLMREYALGKMYSETQTAAERVAEIDALIEKERAKL